MDQFIFEEEDVKRVVFGYGAIRFSTIYQILTLNEIRPPVGAGTRIFTDDYQKVGDWEDTGRSVSMVFNSFDEVKECENWLDQVEAGNCKTFLFKDIIFDYANFHMSGISLFRDALKRVQRGLCLLSAC
jgi:hypothetical protein